MSLKEKIYYVSADVLRASGAQTWSIKATCAEEALRLVKEGEGKFEEDESEVEVTHLDDYYITGSEPLPEKAVKKMSVLECAKLNCANIMCSRYSPEYGYICPTCFSTLVGLGVQQDIQEFLQSYEASSITDAWDHFDGIFKRQDEEEEDR